MNTLERQDPPAPPSTIPIPDTAAFLPAQERWIERANAITVDSAESDQVASLILQGIDAEIRTIKEGFAGPKGAAFALHKWIVAAESKFISGYDRARAAVSLKVRRYREAAEEKAREQQRALEAQARKLEEDRKLAEAQAAHDDGQKEVAEQILEEPVAAPVIHVEPEIASGTGVSMRDNWKAEVVDPKAFFAYVVANWDLCSDLVEVNGKALNGRAKSQKGNLRIPGVKAINDRGLAVRRSA